MYGIHIPSSRITFNLILFLFFFLSFSLLTNMNTLKIPHPLTWLWKVSCLITSPWFLACSPSSAVGRHKDSPIYISCHITNLLKTSKFPYCSSTARNHRLPWGVTSVSINLCHEQIQTHCGKFPREVRKKPGIFNRISLFLSLRWYK